jgi:phage-related tail fiber protein
MPIEIELELTDNDAPIITNFGAKFTAANTSISWKLQNCQIKCDILSLDNALDNSYVNHLLRGNTLKIVYDTYVSSIQTITSEYAQVNVSRSLTSLRSVFMSLEQHVLRHV